MHATSPIAHLEVAAQALPGVGLSGPLRPDDVEQNPVGLLGDSGSMFFTKGNACAFPRLGGEMARELPVAQLIRFGPYTADVRSRELYKSGIKLKLRDQSFHVLAMLLEHPGELVTREQLRQRLWADETFVDFDHGLNAAVERLRRCLGDSALSPAYIETLPRRGYRFVGQLDSSHQTMLAVLPFENLSGDPNEDYFSDGLTEEIITQLGSLSPDQLGVIARTTSMAYNQLRSEYFDLEHLSY